jgi:heat shock protein HslJ
VCSSDLSIVSPIGVANKGRFVLKKTLTCTCSAILLAFFVTFGMALAGGTTGEPAVDLGGITVRSSWFRSGAVTLKNGEYREPAVLGSAITTVIKLTDWRAFGKVDGRDAAAVVLVTDPGGSGTFYDLALLFKGKDGWVNFDTILLGDRVRMHSVDIRDNEIFVNMTTHGPGDALCCPTQEKTRRFAVLAGRLVAENEEKKTGIREPGIVGPVWQWVRTRYNDDTTLAPPADAAGYTFQMKQDGTVHVRGDCNVSGGSFTLNNGKLTITITNTTLAACPEGSLEDPFIRDLNRTSGFLLKNGRLFLDLKLDSGTMEFRESQKMRQ